MKQRLVYYYKKYQGRAIHPASLVYKYIEVGMFMFLIQTETRGTIATKQ